MRPRSFSSFALSRVLVRDNESDERPIMDDSDLPKELLVLCVESLMDGCWDMVRSSPFDPGGDNGLSAAGCEAALEKEVSKKF